MKKVSFFLLVVCSLLTGCEIPGAQPESNLLQARAWFDEPRPSTVFVPPSPCRITAHGASPHGISQFELSINGVAATFPSPDEHTSLVTLTRDCGISNPGEYILELRAQDNEGVWSNLAETRLIISDPSASPESEDEAFTPTPTAGSEAGVTIESLSTNLVYLGSANCSPKDVTITAHAVSPEGITAVVLFYRFNTGNGVSEFESTAMDPIGGDLYRRTLNPTSLMGGAVPFDQAVLEFQVVIQQPDGDTSLRTAVLKDISVQACGGPVVSPPATEIIAPTPTFTPTTPVIR